MTARNSRGRSRVVCRTIAKWRRFEKGGLFRPFPAGLKGRRASVSSLEWHNHGPCGHTVEYRLRSLVVVIEFPTEERAVRFERYLKSGSGRAFAKWHLRGSCEASSEFNPWP